MDADEHEHADEASSIGARARFIRRRRGLSQDVVAGLAGITAQYLSMLERGLRGFNRRGLIEDLADALSCSVADLTGQPYLPPDRQSAEVSAALADLSSTLHDATLHDVPDVPAQPLPALIAAAGQAHAHVDGARYGAASRGLAAVLTGLHVHAVTGSPEDRQAALVGLVEMCQVAYALAKRSGHAELAVVAAQRGCDAALLAERPDLLGMMTTSRSVGLMRLGARRRAVSVSGETLTELSALPGPTPGAATVAQARGMLHLVSALGAARDNRPGDVATHLAEAGSLATHTGERNHFRYHFGPSNVAAWELSIAVESGTGAEAAERFTAAPVDLSVFGSKARESFVLFDLARGWAQAEGARDTEAIRHLDTADRLAPLQVRNDPIALDLARTLDRRAPRRTWELDSLLNRFGIKSARI
ncbi:MAG: helix-turn-helix domain-containing protein [Pseudonocardiaceae bacterium]